MSSRDGAVMRMAGRREEESDDSDDSVLDCDEGGLSVTEREKMTQTYQTCKLTHTKYW